MRLKVVIDTTYWYIKGGIIHVVGASVVLQICGYERYAPGSIYVHTYRLYEPGIY